MKKRWVMKKKQPVHINVYFDEEDIKTKIAQVWWFKIYMFVIETNATKQYMLLWSTSEN